MPGQSPRPGRELRVGQCLVAEPHRGVAGCGGDPRLEHVHQRHVRRGDVVTERVPPGDHEFTFELVDDLDVADRHRRIRRHGPQDPQQLLGEGGDAQLVEQVGGVGDGGGDAGRRTVLGHLLREGELQVEFRRGRVVVESLERETVEFELGLSDVLEGQHHLEQRVPGLGALRVEDLHQPFERHVRVGERVEVALAHRAEQFREGLPALHVRAQDEGVDEHADQVVEGGLAAAGDRGADRDVLGGGQPGQQHRERRVHDHEQRRVLLVRKVLQTVVERLVDVEAAGAAVSGGPLGTGPIGRQVQLVGQPGERALPELHLFGGHGSRLVLGAEHVALPQGVVRVLDLERCPAGQLAAGAGRVGDHHVAGERTQGEPVRGDVMGDEQQHVLGSAQLEDHRTEGHLGGDVEPARDEFAGTVRQGLRVDLLDLEPHRGFRQDLLVAGAVHVGVDGAQHLVALGQVPDRPAQGGHVEGAGETHADRDVVHRRPGVESVEEPHALLRRRQWDALGPLVRGQRGAATRAGLLLGPHRESLDGRGVEQCPHRDRRVERVAEAGRDLRRDEGVAAEIEEVVVAADPRHTQYLGEDARDDLLDRGPRRGEGACFEGRGRQSAPVDLAAGVQRERLQGDEGRRHHVGRQRGGQRVLRPGGVERDARLGNDVADQLRSEARVLAHHGDGLAHLVEGGQLRLDLAEFDTQAAQLDLQVRAAQVVELARGGPPHQVAGAVHPLAAGPGVGDESLGRQIRATVIAPRQLGTGEVELAGDAERHGVQPFVEHERAGVPDRGTDRDRCGVAGSGRPVDGLDRRLGRAVQVVDGCIAQCVQPGDGVGREALAAAEDLGQGRGGRPVEVFEHGVEDGGHELGQGDGVPGDRCRHRGGVAVQVGCADHDPGAHERRQEDLPDRGVEGGGGLEQQDVAGARAELVLHPQQLVDHGGVRHGHTLRPAGGTGRVEHVRKMIRAQRCEPVGVGQGRVAVRCGVGLVERHDRHRARARQTARSGAGENHYGRSGFEDVRDPVGRLVRVERDVGGPRGQDGVDRHEHLRGAARGHRDDGVRSRAVRDEIPRQGVDTGAELAVRPRRLGRLHSHGVGRAGRLPGEEIDQGGVGIERSTGGRAKAARPHRVPPPGSIGRSPTGTSGRSVTSRSSRTNRSPTAAIVEASNRSVA